MQPIVFSLNLQPKIRVTLGYCVRAHRYGDVSIIHQSNDADCFILDIPAKMEEMFRKNFKLRQGEAHSLHNNTAHLAYITNKYAEA